MVHHHHGRRRQSRLFNLMLLNGELLLAESLTHFRFWKVMHLDFGRLALRLPFLTPILEFAH